MKKSLFLMTSVFLLASSGCATKTGSATAGAVGGAAEAAAPMSTGCTRKFKDWIMITKPGK